MSAERHVHNRAKDKETVLGNRRGFFGLFLGRNCDKIFLMETDVSRVRTKSGGLYVEIEMSKDGSRREMAEKSTHYVLREKAVPEVLLKVVEAKRLLESGKVESVLEATEAVGISRSSFYKYKDDIFPYHENPKGRTITMVIQLDDEPGLLSTVLKTIAEFHANILTIHQSVPVGGIASLTLSIDIFRETGDEAEMVSAIEAVRGIHFAKILAKE